MAEDLHPEEPARKRRRDSLRWRLGALVALGAAVGFGYVAWVLLENLLFL